MDYDRNDNNFYECYQSNRLNLDRILQLKMSNKLCFGGFFLILILGSCLIFVASRSENGEAKHLIVKLPDLGMLQGSITRTAWTQQIVYQFLGIPFAESPSHHLRFKSPVPRKPWVNIKSAVKHGKPCPNTHYLNKLSSEELQIDLEDCLNVAIYTKNLEANNPVMVYIHGGGFYNGSAIDHPPNYLLEKDVVLAVPEYRLGILGFLSTQSEEIPGNLAILDLILALQWIQKYIKYFGGDANRVTIFGQSAGAALLNVLMYSPAVPKGLFSRVINQSGSFLAGWAYNENPIALAKQACIKLNCSNCNEVVNINQCLLKIPTVKLLTTVSEENDQGLYSLTIGDKNNILPTIPIELMKNNRIKYPMIGGVTKHDGTFVLALVYDILKAKYSNFSYLNPHDIIDTIITVCKENDESGSLGTIAKKLFFTHKQLIHRNFTDLIPGLVDLSSTLVFKSPVLRLIQLHAKLNPSSTYLYTFDYQGEYTRFGYEAGNDHYPFNGGVHHSDDNLYIFPKYELNEQDTKIAKNLVELWTSFATIGVPKTEKFIEWKPVTSETGPYLHINHTLSLDEDFLNEYLVTVNDPQIQIIRKKYLKK